MLLLLVGALVLVSGALVVGGFVGGAVVAKEKKKAETATARAKRLAAELAQATKACGEWWAEALRAKDYAANLDARLIEDAADRCRLEKALADAREAHATDRATWQVVEGDLRMRLKAAREAVEESGRKQAEAMELIRAAAESLGRKLEC